MISLHSVHRKFYSLFLSLILLSVYSYPQDSACKLRISLLTCSPGEELYSSWGHTAIRVLDSTNGSDYVFNYGTFDDSDPMFLPRFTKGLMIYSLSAYPFSEFVREYQYFKRGVIEQVLDLRCEAKRNLLNALIENNKEPNRFYEYYFHEDNCTTRTKDMIVKNAGAQVNLGKVIADPAPSFRNLIHFYLDSSHQAWNKFGIDILLGANLDKKASNEQAMFLPDYLLMGFDKATINNHPLVSEKRVILVTSEANSPSGFFTPLIVFSLLTIFIIGLSFSKSRRFIKFINVFDVLFFLLLGLLGVLLAVLWIIRIDTVCRNNFNLLWALPTHLPVAFVLLRNKSWVKKYFRFITFISLLLLISWYFIPQQLNTAVLPILAIILVRSWKRSK